MRRLLLAALLPLCACSAWPQGSYVQIDRPADAVVLAPTISGFVANTVPPGSIVCLSTPGGEDDPLTPMVQADLRHAGVPLGQAGVPVTYLAGPALDGTLLRITVGETVAAQFFSRDTSGALQPGGPMTVMTP